MNIPDESFDDALDAAIDALRNGQPLDAVLVAHPAHAAQLRPLLDVAVEADAAGARVPAPSARLASNFAAVRAAIRRARAERPAMRELPPPRRWWQRRMAVASLSLPASAMLAVVAVGVSGAAAAAVVARPDLPARIAGAVPSGWAGDLVPGPDDSPGVAPQRSNPPAQTTLATDTTATAHAMATITVSGVVSDVRDRTFMLGTAEAAWSVHVDDATHVTGKLERGARATVSGSVAADGAVDARDIRITIPDATSTVTDGKAVSDSPPGDVATPVGQTPGPLADQPPGPPTDQTPGPPAGHTPGPPAGHTPGPPAGHTPGPPSGHTPGPPASHTPPGHGNAGGKGKAP
jgi:hypothetical protein